MKNHILLFFSTCQLQLPATGAPPVTQPVEQLNDRFEEYFCKRTLQNWKYFIVSLTLSIIYCQSMTSKLKLFVFIHSRDCKTWDDCLI